MRCVTNTYNRPHGDAELYGPVAVCCCCCCWKPTKKNESGERTSDSVVRLVVRLWLAESGFTPSQHQATSKVSIGIFRFPLASSAERSAHTTGALPPAATLRLKKGYQIAVNPKPETWPAIMEHAVEGDTGSMGHVMALWDKEASTAFLLGANLPPGFGHTLLVGWPLPLALGFWSGRALASGTAWEGLCLVHHHHRRTAPATEKIAVSTKLFM